MGRAAHPVTKMEPGGGQEAAKTATWRAMLAQYASKMAQEASKTGQRGPRKPPRRVFGAFWGPDCLELPYLTSIALTLIYIIIVHMSNRFFHCIKIGDLMAAPHLGPQACVRQACAIRPAASRIDLSDATRWDCAQQLCANIDACTPPVI